MKKVCKKNDRYFYTLFLNITICFYIKIPLKYGLIRGKILRFFIYLIYRIQSMKKLLTECSARL